MKVTAKQISDLLGGEIIGDENVTVNAPAKIEDGQKGAISFLGNMKYEHYVYSCASSIILVAQDFEPKQALTATLIKVADVYSSLGILLEYFNEATQSKPTGVVSPEAFIHESVSLGTNPTIDAFAYVGKGATIGDNVRIYPQVYVGEGVNIGDNVTLYSGVKIYKDCRLDNQIIIHANAVIGSDGFGFAPQADGSFQKIPQLGNVWLKDSVEIGANTVIDRATMGSTVIERGVKLDNLIQVAHNVSIGKNTVVASQVGIAGSTHIGENCMVGGQVGFAGHLQIANGTKIQAQSGLAQSVKQENTALWGSPAMDYKKYFRSAVIFKRLPELQQQITFLQKELDKIQKK